jgi:hypothetical protein
MLRSIPVRDPGELLVLRWSSHAPPHAIGIRASETAHGLNRIDRTMAAVRSRIRCLRIFETRDACFRMWPHLQVRRIWS